MKSASELESELCEECPIYGQTGSDHCFEKALQYVIEMLDQEPCEDAVSRKAVLENIDDCNSDGLKGIFCSYDSGERFKEYIKNLPPVIPQPKQWHSRK